MADTNQNLTVLVKKKDGSFERVPLSDLKNKTNNKPVTTNTNLPQVVKPEPLAPIAEVTNFDLVPPTRKISEDQNKKIVVIKTAKDRSELFDDNKNNSIGTKIGKTHIADFKTPLEDALPSSNNPRLPNDSVKIEQAQKLIASLSFNVPVDLKDRLQSAALLFLKDVRSKAQTQDLLSRPVRAGGLDLSSENIKEFFNKASGKFVAATTTELAKEGELELATTTPFNPFVHGKLPPLDNLKPKTSTKTNLEKAIFELQSQPTKKVRMNDVIGTEKIYGPVEEIKNFSLVDLRRLSSSTEDAVKRLEQKFINIKTESVILYFQALAAWQKSPLHLEYINALVKSLKDNLSLEKILQSDPNGLKLSEANFLIKMGESLEI